MNKRAKQVGRAYEIDRPTQLTKSLSTAFSLQARWDMLIFATEPP